MNDKVIPQGYQQTEVGIIPEDWKVVRLGDAGRITTGSTPPTSDKKNYGDEYLFVSPVDIKENKYIKNTEKKVSKKGFELSRALNKGSVLFVCIGSTIGKTAIANQDLITNQQINAIYSNTNCNQYIYYLLYFNSAKIKLLAGKQAVPQLNKSDFSKIKIPLPPKPEQQKIAEILTTWDKAIEKQSALITQKQQLKKGLMQKLFSQEVRFKADDGSIFPDWEEKRLGDVGIVIGGGTPSTEIEQYWDGEISWFTPTEIKSKYINKSIRSISKTGLQKSSAKLLPKNALLLTTRATIGDIGVALGECATNQGFQSIIVHDKHSFMYIYHWIVANKKEFVRRASGSTFLEISKKEVQKIKLLLPHKDEQEKVSNILNNTDDEITKLKQELGVLKVQKKGLMQKLLTGQVRVGIN